MKQSNAISFKQAVLRAVRRIPPGRVATYGDVAAWSGFPGAARAVGHVMATSTGLDAPCHRVVAAGGLLGGYGGQEAIKRALLLAEGVRVVGRRIRAFAEVRWAGPGRHGHRQPSPRRHPR